MLDDAVDRLRVDAPGAPAAVASAVLGRGGMPVDPRLLEGVRDAHLVPEDLLREPGRG